VSDVNDRVASVVKSLALMRADLPAIEWLEEELMRTRGALVLISHDRRFLESMTREMVWLDRGTTRRLEEGFAGFEAWRDFILPRLDARTFDGLDDLSPEAVDGFMRRVWRALASGVHDTPDGRVAWGDVGAGTGPA
jgi:hypothetical protein